MKRDGFTALRAQGPDSASLSTRAAVRHGSAWKCWFSTRKRAFRGCLSQHNQRAHLQAIDSMGCAAHMSHNHQNVKLPRSAAFPDPPGAFQAGTPGLEGNPSRSNRHSRMCCG